jgi:hypothetical protein
LYTSWVPNNRMTGKPSSKFAKTLALRLLLLRGSPQ